ncbi:MAG: DNA-formamidopyrimidine glycosylase family protein [Myxococcota bacterium]
MPEGDTIFRAARHLRRALVGAPVTRCELRPPRRGGQRLDIGRGLRTADLAGRCIVDVESRGKNLLIHFEDDLVLYSHMKMTGSWHIYRPGEPWRKSPRWLSVRIDNSSFVAVAFNVPIVELMTAARLRRHPLLARLGPDLLAARPHYDEMLRRLLARPETPLGEALLDQQILAGIGNVYKSELCFLLELNHFAPVGGFSKVELRELLESAGRLMRENLGSFRRTTRHHEGARHWVYGRAGEPCGRCAGPIEMRRQGDQGRSTYFCPSCQPAPSAP